MNRLLLLLCVLLWACNPPSSNYPWLIDAPAGQRFAQINTERETVLPNGKVISTYGDLISLQSQYITSCFQKGSEYYYLLTKQSGQHQLSVWIYDASSGMLKQEGKQIMPFSGMEIRDMAVHPERPLLYFSTGTANKLIQYDLQVDTIQEISCGFSNQSIDYTRGNIGALSFDGTGQHLYALDQQNGRLIILDTEGGSILANIPTGKRPFAVCIAPDQRHAYVACEGPYPYDWLKATEDLQLEDSVYVWQIDMEQYRLIGKVNCGFRISPYQRLVGDLIHTDDYLILSNPATDELAFMNGKELEFIQSLTLQADRRLKELKGVFPGDMVYDPAQRLLFVAETGLNAVAEINLNDLRVAGHIPTACYPFKVQYIPSANQLLIANQMGLGSRPRQNVQATLNVIEVPGQTALEAYSREVIRNNFHFYAPDAIGIESRKANPLPIHPGASPSPIQYIVWIEQAGGSYTETFGVHAEGQPLENHWKLAEQFAIAENFYATQPVDNLPYTQQMVQHLQKHKVPYWEIESPVKAEKQWWNTYNNRIEAPKPAFAAEHQMVDLFIQEFNRLWMMDGEPLPPVIILQLSDDHEIGRVVEFLSRTPFWANMAILVSGNGAHNGQDRVSIQRSPLMVISPYAKAGFISKEHYSPASILKSIWHLIDLPYLNLEDASATDLADLFQQEANPDVYDLVEPEQTSDGNPVSLQTLP